MRTGVARTRRRLAARRVAQRAQCTQPRRPRRASARRAAPARGRGARGAEQLHGGVRGGFEDVGGHGGLAEQRGVQEERVQLGVEVAVGAAGQQRGGMRRGGAHDVVAHARPAQPRIVRLRSARCHWKKALRSRKTRSSLAQLSKTALHVKMRPRAAQRDCHQYVLMHQQADVNSLVAWRTRSVIVAGSSRTPHHGTQRPVCATATTSTPPSSSGMLQRILPAER